MLKVLELQSNFVEMLDHIPAIGGKHLGLVLLISCIDDIIDIVD